LHFLQCRESLSCRNFNALSVAPEALKRVRRPFVTTRAQGTGLGLAIVDRLVREAGGRLELESAPGRGTTCRVRLPAAKSS